MTSNLVKTIREAIKTQRELLLTVKHGLGDELEVPFQPYIQGQDKMQYEFVWGYLSYSMVFYKLYIENIISAKLTDVTYTVLPNACYQYALEEEHYAVLQDFHNIYSDAARLGTE
jgi:hypothetical protein